jgi:3-deoxy-D-manno-octulosonic acid kinase
MRDDGPPAGYVQFTAATARVVCAEHLADSLRTALADTTLYDYAARQPAARPLAGRGTAYAVTLPGTTERVVIRHNRHGGFLAPLTGDLFRSPTRAPLELRVSERLRALDIPTPRVVAYVTYSAFAGFERADVASREVAESEDLSAALMSNDSSLRVGALHATAMLVAALAQAGARHHDLNVKNILVHKPRTGDPSALVLDVDRVEFSRPGLDVLEANLARLIRSARKWQSVHGARVTELELLELVSNARARFAAHIATLS